MLPIVFLPHGGDHRIHGLDEKLGYRVPPFWEKGITIEVRNSFFRRYFLVSSSVVLISSFHCIVLFSLSAIILIVVDI